MSEPSLRQIQTEHRVWALRNFGEHPADDPFIGLVEEVGELAHHHIKAKHGIRGSLSEHEAKAKDAIGDIVMCLLGYASVKGWDLQEIIEETWAQIRERDWVADPLNGKPGMSIASHLPRR